MDKDIKNNTQVVTGEITKTLVRANLIFEQRLIIYKERRRQASWAFNLTWGLTGISGLLGILAAVLLFSGRISDGVYTAAGGGMYGIVTASCQKQAKDANDRLDEAARALEDES